MGCIKNMDEFNFNPPDRQEYSDSLPINAEAAWILQLIDIKLTKADISDEIRKEFIDDITPYIINASLTQVRRSEVKMFLGVFEELWMKFKIFKFRKKKSPHLSYVKTLIEGYLMQNYNKSIDGWQGNHIFERKQTYDVRQTNSSITDGSSSRRWWDKKNKQNIHNEAEEVMHP